MSDDPCIPMRAWLEIHGDGRRVERLLDDVESEAERSHRWRFEADEWAHMRQAHDEFQLAHAIIVELVSATLLGRGTDADGLMLVSDFVQRHPGALPWLRQLRPASAEYAEAFNSILARAQAERRSS